MQFLCLLPSQLAPIAYFPEWEVEVLAVAAYPISYSLCQRLLHLKELFLCHCLLHLNRSIHANLNLLRRLLSDLHLRNLLLCRLGCSILKVHVLLVAECRSLHLLLLLRGVGCKLLCNLRHHMRLWEDWLMEHLLLLRSWWFTCGSIYLIGWACLPLLE